MSESTPTPHHGPAGDQPGTDLSKHFTPEVLAELETAMQGQAELTATGRAGAMVGTLIEPTPAKQHWLAAAGKKALPEWAHSGQAIAGALRHQRDLAAYRIMFHSLRTPVYGARIAVLAGYGTWRVAADVTHWALAAEYAREIVRAKKSKDDARVLTLRDERSAVAKARLKSKRLAVGAGGSGLYVSAAVITAMLGAWVVAGPMLASLGAVLAALGYRAKKHDASPDGDPGDVYRFLDALPSDAGPVTDERIIAALRAVGVLKADESLRPVGLVDKDKNGATTHVFDLPTRVIAAEVIPKKAKVAGALGLAAEQLDIEQAGPEGRVSLWVSKRVPFSGDAATSPLTTAKVWSIWNGAPFGTTRRGARKAIDLLWSSMLFGGAQGFGKTTAMRIPAAAAVLDPHAQILLADFKGGADWEALEEVAQTAIIGADPAAVEAFVALVDRLIGEMDRRFALIRSLPKKMRPEMRLTPELARDRGMPVLALIIDEIQEAFGALLAGSEGKKEFEALVEKLARLIRRGRACGLIVIAAAQRPDAKSVPTAFRDVILKRYSVHTVDDTSSDMILGDGMAKRGHSAAGLGIIGVGVLAEEGGAERIQVDRITPEQFEEICLRGRQLRLAAGTLSGFAARGTVAAGSILALIATAFEQAEVAELGTGDLVALLHKLDPAAGWGRGAEEADRAFSSRTGAKLGKAVKAALEGTGRTLAARQVTTLSGKAGNGYTLGDVQTAIGA